VQLAATPRCHFERSEKSLFCFSVTRFTQSQETLKMPKKIKVNIFDDMKAALKDAAAYERGEPVNLRVTRIPSRPKPISAKEVRQIRQTLNASQSLFASYLNVSPNAVRSWEQGTRRPRQAALKLLAIAKKNPKALLVA
jgi:putative transcriptional regulator